MVTPKFAEVLIVGAGVVGSSLAYHLSELGVNSIIVVDPDLEGEFSSSELNAGGVRGTWTTAVNVELSRRSIEFFETKADEFGYRAVGYLWLHRAESFSTALQAREMHLKSGWPVDVLDVSGIQKKAPFIDKTSDLVGALFGKKDGLINPNALKNWYREEARRNGVQFLNQTVFHSVIQSGQKWDVELGAVAELNADSKRNSFSRQVWDLQGRSKIQTNVVVNCAGPWANVIAKKMNAFCPSFALRRQISLFQLRDLDLTPYGMIIDPSGVYFHPEATYGLAGYADPRENPGFNLDYDGESFFQEQIWPALYERSTYFESLKHHSGWGGLYEVSPDHHAIIGRMKIEGRSEAQAYECHSFSGHGVMQCHAAAQSLAELIVKGRMESETIPALNVNRFLTAKSFASESWVI